MLGFVPQVGMECTGSTGPTRVLENLQIMGSWTQLNKPIVLSCFHYLPLIPGNVLEVEAESTKKKEKHGYNTCFWESPNTVFLDPPQATILFPFLLYLFFLRCVFQFQAHWMGQARVCENPQKLCCWSQHKNPFLSLSSRCACIPGFAFLFWANWMGLTLVLEYLQKKWFVAKKKSHKKPRESCWMYS